MCKGDLFLPYFYIKIHKNTLQLYFYVLQYRQVKRKEINKNDTFSQITKGT